MVLGGHGDDMVPVRSTCLVGGVPVEKLIPAKRLDEIEARVRNAGGEVVALLKTGSAYFSPASAAIRMTEAYFFDKKKFCLARRCWKGNTESMVTISASPS